MAHVCHWPGCAVSVDPKFWGCRKHWQQLPWHIRQRLLDTYQPGQERTKRPSEAYLAAAREAKAYANMMANRERS